MKTKLPIEKKPFPWTCSACGKKEVREGIVEYSFTAQHDNKPVVVSIPDLQTPKCSACGEIVFDQSANARIAHELRKAVGVLGPDEIRADLAEIGITQKELAAEIEVAPETLSRWVSGTIIQTSNSDRRLRKGIQSLRRKKSSQQSTVQPESVASDYAILWEVNVRESRHGQELVASARSAWNRGACLGRRSK